MRVCLKRKIFTDSGKSFQKHQEGKIKAVKWTEEHDQFYLIDFDKEGIHYVLSKDCDLLNM